MTRRIPVTGEERDRLIQPGIGFHPTPLTRAA